MGEPATSAPEAVRPAEVEWPITQVGQATVPVPITVVAGEAGAEVRSVSLEGADAADFQVISDGCLSVPLALNSRCQLDLLAEPSTSGSRTAQLVIVDDSGARTVVPLEVFAERSKALAGAPSYEFIRQDTTGGKVYKIGKSVTVSFHLAVGGRADELETPTLQISPETGYEAGDYRPATSVTNRGDIFASVKHGNYRYKLQTAGRALGRGCSGSSWTTERRTRPGSPCTSRTVQPGAGCRRIPLRLLVGTSRRAGRACSAGSHNDHLVLEKCTW